MPIGRSGPHLRPTSPYTPALTNRQPPRPSNANQSRADGSSSDRYKIWGRHIPKEKKLKSGLQPVASQDIAVPLDSDVAELEAGSAGAIDVEIRNLEFIGSYSWMKASTPTIVVPGMPRKWVGTSLPLQLPADQTATFVDQNGYLVPSFPLLPLFLAVDAMPDVRTPSTPSATYTATARVHWPGTDFITDRNNLRKLLGWVNGKSDKKQWRIDTQLVGNKTMLLSRWEPRTAVGADGKGFGHTFELGMTVGSAAAGNEVYEGYRRIIKYVSSSRITSLDGLNMVVRFEVDAYMELPPTFTPPHQISQGSQSSSSRPRNRRRKYSTKANAPASQPQSNPNQSAQLVKVIHGGTFIPHQSSIIEIKTCLLSKMSSKKSESYPQLFFSQTPHLYVAGHTGGMFSEIDKNDVSKGDLAGQHDTLLLKNGALKRLIVALRRIRELVRREGKGRRLTLVFEAKVLRVYQRAGGSGGGLLPEDVIARFEVQ